MNRLVILSLLLYVVAAVRAYRNRYEKISKSLNDEFERRNRNSGNKPFNLRENINYERKNNYELYIDVNGELKQERFNVKEPRQVLKKNMEQFRYLINDLEILFGVYKFNSRDKEKVLRETLKPESLCFTILGLLETNLNKINVDDSPIYGLLINGERNSNEEVSTTLGIYVILSNITVSMGSFTFPELKNAPYQIPYLVGHYDSRSGYKSKQFSYLCPLPTFFIDVIRTTKFGLKVNFNGLDMDARELFPVTLSYALKNGNVLPVQKEDNYKDERKKLIEILKKEGKDISYRFIKDQGVEGNGIKKPEERILVTKSFINSREKIKNFLTSSGKTTMDTDSMAIYFLALSQNLFSKWKNAEAKRLTKIEVTNIQKNNAGYLAQYTIKLGLEDSTWITTEGIVKGKNIFVPRELSGPKNSITYDVPFVYGLFLNESSTGLTYTFAGLSFLLKKALPYNVNNLSSFVSGK
ncbi:secreted ookinete protein, putative (PSOP1) [Plasmodium ovale wallikeri]|uniref:Secreted ookinete protein, putative n=2 Tax=Plasmodium ovale TaxID=36330 RepID=A0A1C3KNC1_PLAOA|nr:secreted ookinete protein, putative (PSOP1) [Plasmodium ovale wallikeri]SBT31953.1 secreted ookinete protein, putative (PSOP1) [Plasmodium ovale wallikeri]SBT75551.1 secreted ookinete protein, putative [Plasmodium ovale]